ncbi:uncharacterized protein EV154DRAFT_486061 [Mucor mucedo]|uniref:uncharacterized protein n=1 Tax=Mucor mucedo TaxID=29922 RepID=UPI0022203586|nr:uncharacterized protein EV154DRAFT_486061 [Mucor mucedo]KAI7879335.1 hypothetical protein EV154DRAFT_486061 [Mucor mucedo]
MKKNTLVKPAQKKQLLTIKTYQELTRKYDESGRTRPNRTRQRLKFYSHISMNTNNSCFIDATFELHWNCVFPAIDFSGLDVESDNIFDQVLISSYQKYIEPQFTDVIDSKHCLTPEVSSKAREFIWAIPKTKGTGFQYPRGECSDCLEVLNLMMTRSSPEFQEKVSNFPIGLTLRSHICSVNPNHGFVDPSCEFSPLFEIGLEMRSWISAKKTFASQADLDQEFSNVFKYIHIIREMKHACRQMEGGERCLGTITSQNSVSLVDFAAFLFIGNARGHGIDEDGIYFPHTFTMSESIKYEI